MKSNSRIQLLGASAAVALMMAGSTSASMAADMAMPGKAGRTQVVPMAVGGWLFSPTLFAGAIYNSNINQTNGTRISGWGERVVPGFSATLNNGIHQTSLYGIADIQNYSAAGATHKTTLDAKAGVTQTYLAQRDLTIRYSGDFTRQSDVFGAAAFAPANTPLAPTTSAPVTATTVAPAVSPVRYNQYSSALAVDKRLGRAFVGVSVSAISTQFDKAADGTVNRNGTIYTVAERTGFDITPQIYAFVDPSVHWQRFTDSTRNSNGYRVTSGLGTIAAGLWQGEIYGGYQAEKNDIIGTYSSGVYGLRVGYSPTRMWDFRASLDESLGASTILIGSNGLPLTSGIAAKTTTGLLSVGYHGLPQGWSTGARFGYVRTTFVNLSRTDNAWVAGANVSYEIWRNLGVTADYQYKTSNSNIAGQSFNQQMVSLGLSYKY